MHYVDYSAPMVNLIATAIVAAAALQSSPSADIAARMTGRWTLNTHLTDQAAGRGGRGGGAAFALAPGAGQRGGRGGGGNVAEPPPQMPGLTPAEGAAQRALGVVQQVPREITITATATTITFVEPRGDSVFQIDGKNAAIEVPGGTIKVKSKWDRAGLRQEFSSTQRVLHRIWSVDASGRLLVLKQRLEGIGLSGKETQAVFDRQ
jgi:hypothetical protein